MQTELVVPVGEGAAHCVTGYTGTSPAGPHPGIQRSRCTQHVCRLFTRRVILLTPETSHNRPPPFHLVFLRYAPPLSLIEGREVHKMAAG